MEQFFPFLNKRDVMEIWNRCTEIIHRFIQNRKADTNACREIDSRKQPRHHTHTLVTAGVFLSMIRSMRFSYSTERKAHLARDAPD